MKLETRISIEKRIARKLVRALLKAGYTLGVDNGSFGLEVDFSTSEQEVLSYMFGTDDEHVTVRKDGLPFGWVHLVYGNDGWDVIADYTLNLEPVIESLYDYINKLEAKYS